MQDSIDLVLTGYEPHPAVVVDRAWTVTTFGTAVDITAAELGIEAFLPADAHTAGTIRALTEAAGTRP